RARRRLAPPRERPIGPPARSRLPLVLGGEPLSARRAIKTRAVPRHLVCRLPLVSGPDPKRPIRQFVDVLDRPEEVVEIEEDVRRPERRGPSDEPGRVALLVV